MVLPLGRKRRTLKDKNEAAEVKYRPKLPDLRIEDKGSGRIGQEWA